MHWPPPSIRSPWALKLCLRIGLSVEPTEIFEYPTFWLSGWGNGLLFIAEIIGLNQQMIRLADAKLQTNTVSQISDFLRKN